MSGQALFEFLRGVRLWVARQVLPSEYVIGRQTYGGVIREVNEPYPEDGRTRSDYEAFGG